MSVVEELIRLERNGEISFGNYKLPEKAKLDDFAANGDLYKVKTCKEMTKLEKNGSFLYESVPGTTVTGFDYKENGVRFTVEGDQAAQVILELEDGAEYDITINGENAGTMATSMGGKITLSVELSEDEQSAVIIEKK